VEQRSPPARSQLAEAPRPMHRGLCCGVRDPGPGRPTDCINRPPFGTSRCQETQTLYATKPSHCFNISSGKKIDGHWIGKDLEGSGRTRLLPLSQAGRQTARTLPVPSCTCVTASSRNAKWAVGVGGGSGYSAPPAAHVSALSTLRLEAVILQLTVRAVQRLRSEPSEPF
jgi:hypothetical protein